MVSVSRVGTWAGPNPLLVCLLWSLINHEGLGTSESPQPSRTTGHGTWAEERQFPSLGARGMVFPSREGALGLLECWEVVVRHPGTHPSCPQCGVGMWKGPPLVLPQVAACLGTLGQYLGALLDSLCT